MSASQRTPERSQQHAAEPEQTLAEYRRRQLELAEVIRGGMNLASDRRTDHRIDHRAESGRDLLTRLADDRFQLAVMGQFSRGKSTLMNAILGQPYLPTGAVPMTAVITRVQYGSRPRATVRRRGGHGVPIETPLGELVKFVAESSTEREERQVISADVRVPAEILRLGFRFVDTPGIGSAVAANTAATRRFLSEADAVMFVTAFDSPLSEAEVRFLTEARRHVEKLFYVINKLDLVSAGEAGEVVDFVRRRLSQGADTSAVRVFATSARDALQAKLHGTDHDLTASGLPELEQALIAFMTADKARTFLLGVSSRAERLLERLRLDLELGRAASSAPPARAGETEAVFNQRVEDLVESEQRAADRLAARVESELPTLLAARADRWMQELRRVVLAELEAWWPEPKDAATISGSAQEAAAYLNDRARRRFSGWLDERAGETLSLLIELAAAELDALYSMRESVDGLGAASFGVRLDDSGAATWSPAELPQLAVRQVTLEIESPRSRRVGARSRDLDRRNRMLDAIDAALVAYGEAVRSELVRAARQWSQLVASAVQDETRRRAERLAANARNPGTPAQFATLERLERDLTAFRARTADWEPSTSAAPSARPEPRPPAPAQPATRCAICQQVAEVPFDFMTRAQWALARQPESRAEHIEAGGFCPLHTWEYAEIASELGMALAYGPVAQAAADLLDHGNADGLPSAISKLLPGPARCPACAELTRAEHAAVHELVSGMPTRLDGANAPSLCVPHLAQVLETGLEPETARWLSRRLATTLSRAAEDLRTYALKRDAMRAYLLDDEENAAARVVISNLAGSRAVVRPWRHTGEIG
ncbi:MAG TPA: dynamin family protein [Solirubrobacteraceae bacterium]|nr:dynamin family protein [Solirubrobacteraceae bacterium]